MAINGMEELNNYYQYFNQLVDDYMLNNGYSKIRPSNLKKYLNPNSEKFNRFLERSKSKIKKNWGVEINDEYGRVVLKNIIDDRYNMEKDGILTYESYSILESDEFKIKSMKECLYKGIDKATRKMEKIISDFLTEKSKGVDINLSDIDISNSDKHEFRVENWNNDSISIIIYSKEDMDIIKMNIIEHISDDLSEKDIEVNKNFKIKLSEIIDKDLVEKKMNSKIDNDYLINIIEDITEYEFKGEKQDHYIWIHVTS